MKRKTPPPTPPAAKRPAAKKPRPASSAKVATRAAPPSETVLHDGISYHPANDSHE